MDPSPLPPTTPTIEEDEWDTEGFEIPSLGIGHPNQSEQDAAVPKDLKPSSSKAIKEEKIYLGPHGAPPQSKQQELNTSSRKLRLKQKLKEADKRICGTGRENKLESLQELVGGDKLNVKMSKGSPRDWLDSHCNESQFENWYSH